MREQCERGSLVTRCTTASGIRPSHKPHIFGNTTLPNPRGGDEEVVRRTRGAARMPGYHRGKVWRDVDQSTQEGRAMRLQRVAVVRCACAGGRPRPVVIPLDTGQCPRPITASGTTRLPPTIATPAAPEYGLAQTPLSVLHRESCNRQKHAPEPRRPGARISEFGQHALQHIVSSTNRTSAGKRTRLNTRTFTPCTRIAEERNPGGKRRAPGRE